MAKINKVSRENIWQVRIHVEDAACTWNVHPLSTYYKIIRANSAKGALSAAATYCNKQMRNFPGVHFKHSTEDVKPYYCSAVHVAFVSENDAGIKRTKI